MNMSFTGLLARFPAGAAILYVGLVMVFAITAWTTVAEILDRRDAVAATAAVLSQLEGRNPAAPGGRGKDGDPTTAGSPLLDGGGNSGSPRRGCRDRRCFESTRRPQSGRAGRPRQRR